MAQTMLRDYLQQTEDALSSGRIKEALAHCQSILNHFPGSLEARRLLGEAHLAQGELQEAQQAFDWILRSDPENVVVYCDCALISERKSDFDTALDCYQQAYELSRGNSQIRQVFNSLSAKLGQPDFMFSRAGLARLYMRGDLLMQAIQEWETVLVATPDRPDARTGLLEAFWRESQYERVEQLAEQILQEFPTCLKALLLHAHTTSMHHMDKAQELIQRAEVLDPELVMAQELFSDLMAQQPDAPFLALLKKHPISFPEVLSPYSPTPVATTSSNGTQTVSVTTDPLSNWSNLEAAISSQKDYQEFPEYTAWSSSDSGQTFKEADLPAPPPWLDILTHREKQQPITSSSEIELEPPTTKPPAPQPSIEPQPLWAAVPQAPTVSQEEVSDATPLFVLEDSDDKGWPEWLKSLGAPILEPASQAATSAVLPEPQQEYPPSTAQVPGPVFEQTTAPLPPPEEHLVTTLENLEQSLYSQGFTPLEPGTLSTIAQSAQEPTLSSALAQLGDLSLPPSQPDMPVDFTPTATLPPAAIDPPQPLWSVEPGPEYNPSPSVGNEVLSEPVVPAQDANTSTGISSAEVDKQVWSEFAALGQDANTSASSPSAEVDKQVWSEPAALAQDANTSANFPSAGVDKQLWSEPVALAQDANTSASSPSAEVDNQLWSEPVALGQDANTSTNFPSAEVDNQLWPELDPDNWVEDELEVTMKMPTIQLRPIQQLPKSIAEIHIEPFTEPPTIPIPGLFMGPASQPAISSIPEMLMPPASESLTISEADDDNLSLKEGLFRGYHYQVAGEYDKALQEYRTLIRSTPELLAEVINNLQILVKSTPQYSPGYRVLGDAYMCQGEYLQAMEAYNQALSMSKKAKGRAM